MADYRIYVTDENGHIQRAVNFACGNEEEVRNKARSLLGEYPCVEVWQGARKICVDKLSDVSGS